MEELKEMKKIDVRNAANIRRMMEEEKNTAHSFNFPLRTEAEHDNLKECLQKRRFARKLECVLH